MAKPTSAAEFVVDDIPIRISSPDRELRPGWSKTQVLEWFQAVEPALRNRIQNRALYVVRATRAGQDPFFQKRAPANVPDWMGTVTVPFPSGRSALAICPGPETVLATLAWLINLGGIEFHTWPSSAPQVEAVDELRIDLDPEDGLAWDCVVEAALLARGVLDEHGLAPRVSWSGKHGLHLVAPVLPHAPFDQARAAALGVARELERRRPDLITASWWKEQRNAPIFCDFNQMLLDRTMAMPFSPRVPAGSGVVLPLEWHELGSFVPHEISGADALAIAERAAQAGTIDRSTAGGLSSLVELHDAQRDAGAPQAPYPPHYPKAPDEPDRVTPSRRRPDAPIP